MKIQPYSQQPLVPNNNGRSSQPMSPMYAELMPEERTEKLDLRQALSVLRRRAFVVATVSIAVASAIGYRTLTRPPQYESSFRLLVEPITSETKVAQNFGAIVYSSLDYDTQIEVLRSPTVGTPIVEQLKNKYPEIDFGTLMANLSIMRLGETKIIEVRFLDGDRQKVRDVLEEVSQSYITYSRVERQSDVREGIKFVEDQLPNLKLRVDTLQAKLQRFRQQYNFIDPENLAAQLSGRLGAIAQQKLEIQSKINETKLLYATLQNQLGLQPNQAIVAAALSEAPRYQRLLDKLQEIESKIATESVRFTEANPALQSLREEKQKLLPLLRQEAQSIVGSNLNNAKVEPQRLTYQNSVRLELTQQFVDAANQIKVLEVRSSALDRAESSLIQEFKQMPIRAREYTDLQRELKVATESLNRFLSTRESLEIEAAQKAAPWQLIAAPQDPSPISPNTGRNLAIGVIAGLLLGIGAAWLAEMLDNVFYSAEDLKDKTGMPLLGVIPFSKAIKKLAPGSQVVGLLQGESSQSSPVDGKRQHYYGSSPFLEAFRSLYTSVRLLASDTPIRSITISSATPSEGKTVVALNLAQAAAAMGQRVLLVDADLRRPQIHSRLGLPNMRGLSNLISSEDLDFNAVTQQSPIEENLFVLTAGQVPPDPTRLLSSAKMQHLMEQLQTAFNLVIYDTPPLVGFADASLLAPNTEGMVLVVGLGKTDRYPLMQAIDGLRISGTPVLGMVANGVKQNATRSNVTYDRYYKEASRDRQSNGQVVS